jgi:hypothetical protein
LRDAAENDDDVIEVETTTRRAHSADVAALPQPINPFENMLTDSPEMTTEETK